MDVINTYNLIKYNILVNSMGLCELHSENDILLLILTVLMNYSKIIALKYKAINNFVNYIYDTKKFKYLICWYILCT